MEKSENKKMLSVSEARQLQDLRSMGLVINTIVHSFNNAIGLIRGYADLSLRATESDSRVYPYLQHIIEGTDFMKELSEKMRIFTKGDGQEFELVKIAPIVQEAVDSFKESLESPIKVELNIESPVTAMSANADQIRQAVINLCHNACLAVRDNDGTIEVSLKEVDVSENKHLMLTVSDTGKGMDKEVLGQIFEPFFTTQDAGKSAGLGLTIVQAIVKNHKGKIDVDSKPGEGAIFDVYLPLTN